MACSQPRTLVTVALKIGLAIVLVPSILSSAGLARAGTAETAATLSVLAAPVERVAGGGASEPGVDGMDLAIGDRVRTGAGGIALITFLDGSTVTVLASSEVTVKQAPTGSKKSGIRVLIHAGRTWARVVQALGSRSTLTLESNEYAATAHDGLIGAEWTGNSFACWSRRGEVRLSDRSGQTNVVLMPGQRVWAHFGLAPTPEPFLPSASMLEVRTAGPVIPLLRMPDGGPAAGFLARGVEVNQVFGALTGGAGDRWLVEVPGGRTGPYALVLTGTGSGPFTVKVSGRYAGFTVYQQEIRGTIHPDEQLTTRITQRVSGQDPQSARLVEARFEDLRAWDSAEPPAVVASPGRRPLPASN